MEGKKEAHVVALNVSEQVLLMMCKLKVTTPDGPSIKVRGLIDPGSSASFMHEQIVQLLCSCIVTRTQESKESLEPLCRHEGG